VLTANNAKHANHANHGMMGTRGHEGERRGGAGRAPPITERCIRPLDKPVAVAKSARCRTNELCNTILWIVQPRNPEDCGTHAAASAVVNLQCNSRATNRFRRKFHAATGGRSRKPRLSRSAMRSGMSPGKPRALHNYAVWATRRTVAAQ